MKSRWVSVNDRLPAEGIYVLAHVPGRPWGDSGDPTGVFFKVVSLTMGITQAQRAALPDSDERKHTYCPGDEHANNLRGYAWSEFGPGSYFGQEVVRWMTIPEVL